MLTVKGNRVLRFTAFALVGLFLGGCGGGGSSAPASGDNANGGSSTTSTSTSTSSSGSTSTSTSASNSTLPNGSVFVADTGHKAIEGLLLTGGAMSLQNGVNLNNSYAIYDLAYGQTGDRVYASMSDGNVWVWGDFRTTENFPAPSSKIHFYGDGNYSTYLDTANDRLYIANKNAGIGVFNHPGSVNLSTSPDRTISGNFLGSNVVDVYGIAIDTVRNIAYVAAHLSQIPAGAPYDSVSVILVIDNADTMDQQVAPSRIISLTNAINSDCNIFVDSTNDRLYIGAPNATIAVLERASTKSGHPNPDKQILLPSNGSGTKIKVNVPNDVLYASTGAEVLAVTNVSSATGAVSAFQIFAPYGANLTGIAVGP